MDETQAILEEAADVIAQTTDVIEGTLDQMEEVVKYKNDPIILAGVAVIGLSVGALVGYRLAKKYLEPKYAALADEEIKQAKILYAHLGKEGYDSPSVAVEKLIPDDEPEAQAALRKYQGRDIHLTVVSDGILKSERVDQTENIVGTPKEPETQNVFEHQDPIVDKYPGWDYDTEVARRTDSRPFVVTQEEYFENDAQLECISVTYYEGDEVLADGSDGIISDIDGTVGKENLLRFGVGSDEEHLVYIFNKKAGMGFEVARSHGKYAIEVLGFDDEETTQPMPRRGRRFED